MNAFHVVGGLLALWAVVVSFLGITREGFPKTALAERLVMAISIVLVLGAIGTGVYIGATEGGKENEKTVLILPG
jgi:mannose/fructose/N-acetylgalactosamine-specific phosphotransferase system component IIC